MGGWLRIGLCCWRDPYDASESHGQSWTVLGETILVRTVLVETVLGGKVLMGTVLGRPRLGAPRLGGGGGGQDPHSGDPVPCLSL